MQSLNDMKVDVVHLKDVYDKNPAVKALLDDAYDRKRNWGKTTVDGAVFKLKKRNGAGTPLSRQDFVEGMRWLEELGCGRFVIGRRGQASRFEWAVNMISVAKAARGEEVQITCLSSEEAEASDESDDSPAGMVRHSVQLRRDMSIVFDLPSDLTPTEASRLAHIIGALSFEEAPRD